MIPLDGVSPEKSQSSNIQNAVSNTSDQQGSTAPQRVRPVGVTLFAFLFGTSGVGWLFVMTLFVSKVDKFEAAGEQIGIPAWAVFVGILFVAFLYISAAIGAWKGTLWGWWITVFALVYSIVRDLSRIITLQYLSAQLDGDNDRFSKGVVTITVRILLTILIIAYFQRRHVLQYFGLQNRSMFWAIPRLASVALGVAIVLALQIAFFG
ncbi:hypothetical protein K2X85_04375 [bacterium]|nr:hypothetical protein [bacterium]